MKFKKIYIEITNRCNLNCSFCVKSKRIKKEMTPEEFENILININDYTDYLYLHIEGEPLLHTSLDEILKLCSKYNKKVNITTNGTLLKEKLEIIKNNTCVRQINISLHAENKLDNYYLNIFDSVKELDNIYISYRIWVKNKESEIINELVKYYGSKVLDIYDKDNICLSKNIYLNKQEEFEWPSLDNCYYNEFGTCLGLKSHIGILVDGTVTICCLDAYGRSNLGNIFKESLNDILKKDKVTNISNYFNENKLFLDICKHCTYNKKFNKK